MVNETSIAPALYTAPGLAVIVQSDIPLTRSEKEKIALSREGACRARHVMNFRRLTECVLSPHWMARGLG